MGILLNHILLITTALMMVLIIILCICLFINLKEKRRLKSQLTKEQAHYKRFIEYERRASRFKHDLRNKMIAIEYLLKEGREEAGISRLIDIVSEFVCLDYDFVAGEYFWNVIINAKLSDPQYHDIQASRYIQLTDLGHIEELDFSILLGNLLDNALTAAKQSKEKQLEISLIADKGYLFLEIANSYPESSLNDKSLRKSHKSPEMELEHGFGVPRVKEIVKKYKGNYKVVKENTMYQVRILLPHEEEKY